LSILFDPVSDGLDFGTGAFSAVMCSQLDDPGSRRGETCRDDLWSAGVRRMLAQKRERGVGVFCVDGPVRLADARAMYSP
jgi:hypothetical protein